MKLKDIGISKIENADYRCVISGIRKNEAIKLLENIDLTEKIGTFWKFFKNKYQKQFLKL